MKTENEFDEQLEETVKAVKSGTSAVHLCGDDYKRIDDFVTCLAFSLKFTKDIEIPVKGPNGPETKKIPEAAVVEWNYGYGQVNFITRVKIGTPPGDEKIPFPAFLETYKNIRQAEKRIILIRNARHILDGDMNRENLAQLQQTIVFLKKKLPGRAVLIYCDEKKFIPAELTSLVYFLDVKPPSQKELEKITGKFITDKKLDRDKDLIYKLTSRCIGMSEDSFMQILNKAVLDNEKDFADTVLPIAEKTKKQFVDKSGLLKYVNVEVNIEKDVGGLEHLKWWLRQKQMAFNNAVWAKERGIVPAKGILLVGMPGCGKSLTSKAVAAFFGYPLLALDLGSLMGKYLGESEENLRRALNLAENSSPCVLWVDEIEKAFAGVKGDESGVSQRLLGYLLTWLNDKKSQVFVMATANDVSVLPPEFLRRGRFDEVFSVDFPQDAEREHIFQIHLCKEKRIDEEIFKENLKDKKIREQFKELINVTKGYAGSDIEALVNLAFERAGNSPNQYKNPETDIFGILLEQRPFLTPLKEVMAEKIEENLKKYEKYKLTPASASQNNSQTILRLKVDSESDDLKLHLAAAKNELCTPEIMKILIRKGSVEVKLAVLENPGCPPPVISECLAGDNGKEVIEALVNKQPIREDVMAMLKTIARGNEEIKKLLKEKFPEEENTLLQEKACLNCKYRRGLNPVLCGMGYFLGKNGSDVFFLCNNTWQERAPNDPNYCMWCSYNNGKKCTKPGTNGSWRDSCVDFTIIKPVKPKKCGDCKEYAINGICIFPKERRDKDGKLKFDRYYQDCPINR